LIVQVVLHAKLLAVLCVKFVHDNVGAVGAVVSFKIVNVFEFVGPHHVSEILMITFVVHALGVKVNERLFVLSVQVDPPLVEYATAVLGDGHAVSLIVQVVLDP